MNDSLRPRDSQSTRGNRAAAGAAGSILSISPAAEDHAALRRILQPSLRQVMEAESCETAFRLCATNPVAAVIANDVLPDGDWKRVLMHLLSRPDPPKLIVASRLADDRLWAEVLNLGGYDLLIKPFDAEEVRRVVSRTLPPDTSYVRPVRARLNCAVAAAAA